MSDAEHKTVLLVDDDPDFRTLSARLLRELSGARWEIATCASGGDALAWLQQATADLIVLDVNMPVLDGVQLLGLLQRRYPSVPKVILTGDASPDQRAACLTAGAEMVLDKPLAADGWRSVHGALDTLLHAPKEDGFRGVLRRVSLPDVIQMECLAGNSSILEVTGAGLRGRLYIQRGQIVHAQIADLTSVEALNQILCLAGGSFHLLPFTDPAEQTISGPWEFLLMEAARLRDEAGGAAPPAPPPPLPDAATLEAFSIQPAAFADPTPPVAVAPPPPAGQKPVATAQDTPAETTTGMRPVVKETLICSLQGDQLYEWNCPNPAERIALLEFISRRANAMSASLPLGGFDRFECVDKGVRCTTKIEGDQALFVRTQSVLAAGPTTSGTP
jgi:CheY-like chemotaxis protein